MCDLRLLRGLDGLDDIDMFICSWDVHHVLHCFTTHFAAERAGNQGPTVVSGPCSAITAPLGCEKKGLGVDPKLGS